MAFPWRVALVLIVLITLFSPAIRAQSTQDDLRTALLAKPLYLKGLWQKDDLKFDAVGQLQNRSSTETFTLCGVEITSVLPDGNGIRLTGYRVGLTAVDSAHGLERHPLHLSPGPRDRIRDLEKLTITIARPPAGDYAAPLAQIFTEGWEALIPTLPDYWQRYAHKQFPNAPYPPPRPPDATLQPSTLQQPHPYRPGGDISAPRLIAENQPEFNEAARREKFSGNVLVTFIVPGSGVPEKISIIHPVGLGLDEKAVEAVRKYKFKPATRNGEPVPVEINVDVNFQIF